MKRLLQYFKPYFWHSILGPLFKLLEATFELLVPIVVGLIVDKGLGEYVEGAGYVHADMAYVGKMSLLLAGFGLAGCAFAVIAQYFAAKAATGVAAKLRSELFRKMQSLSYKDMDKLGTSTMLTRITGDVDRFQSGVNLGLRLFLRSPFIVVGAVVTAWIVDPGSVFTFLLTVAVCAVALFCTEFIGNAAAAAIFFPIALRSAQAVGADPLSFCVALMIAVSCCFATPIGSPRHMLIYGPGGYRFADFLRVGLPMDILILAADIFIVSLLFPLTHTPN